MHRVAGYSGAMRRTYVEQTCDDRLAHVMVELACILTEMHNLNDDPGRSKYFAAGGQKHHSTQEPDTYLDDMCEAAVVAKLHVEVWERVRDTPADALAPRVDAALALVLGPLLVTLEQCLLEVPARLRRCTRRKPGEASRETSGVSQHTRCALTDGARQRYALQGKVAVLLQVQRRHMLDEDHLLLCHREKHVLQVGLEAADLRVHILFCNSFPDRVCHVQTCHTYAKVSVTWPHLIAGLARHGGGDG
jgi:hypothetical protein